MNSFISGSDPFRYWLYAWGLLGLLPILVFLVATEALLRIAVVPNDHRTFALELLREGKTADAAFGDSQMLSTVTGIPGMLNLSFFGENTAIIDFRIKRFYAGRKPGRVILQATPNMFSDERERATDSGWTRDYIAALQNESDSTLLTFSPHHRMYIKEYWLTFFDKGRFRLRGRIMADGAYFDPKPVAETMASDEFQRKIVSRVAQQRPRPTWQETVSYRYYVESLKFLAKHVEAACLVTTPFPPSYRKEAARFPEFLAVRHHFDDLARRFRFGRVDLWEALDDDASFADTDHLLMEPAREISQQIQRECFAETD